MHINSMVQKGALAALALAAVLSLAACTSGGGSSPAVDRAPAASESAMEQDRSIVTTADLTIEVSDPARASSEVAEIADDLGGRVESQSLNSDTSNSSASITMRVPADMVDRAFEQLGEIGEVRNQNLTATDVTAEHVDLQARVEALQTSVDRLETLIVDADTTSELIEAESALTQRQAELDGLQAQLDTLEGQVNEATIWVNLVTASVLPGGPSNFWEGLLAGLDSIWIAASSGLVLLGVLLPWLVIAGVIALIVILGVRASRARSKRRAGAERTPTPGA